jgi:hypothetical protein
MAGKGGLTMRLPWRDALASLFVAVCAIVVVAWAIGTGLPGFDDVRAIAIVVLVLGVAASASAVVPGFVELLHGSRAYLAAASALGVAALAAGAWALVSAEPAGLALLAAATVVLWAMSTMRHMGIRPEQRLGHR